MMARERITAVPEDQCGPVIGSQVVLGQSDRAAVVLHVLIGDPGGILAKLSANLQEPISGGRDWMNELRAAESVGGFRIAFDYEAPTEPLSVHMPRRDGDPVWRQEMGSGSDVS